jgi:DNA repair protein RadC
MRADEVKLVYKTKTPASKRWKVESSKDAYAVLRPYFEECLEHHEQSWVILLNRANRVLGVSKIGEGNVSACIVDARKIMQCAILANASGIILAHNHPSGKLEFSEADKKMNTNLKEAGRIMDIPMLDSLIITSENYMSAADEGAL